MTNQEVRRRIWDTIVVVHDEVLTREKKRNSDDRATSQDPDSEMNTTESKAEENMGR